MHLNNRHSCCILCRYYWSHCILAYCNERYLQFVFQCKQFSRGYHISWNTSIFWHVVLTRAIFFETAYKNWECWCLSGTVPIFECVKKISLSKVDFARTKNASAHKLQWTIKVRCLACNQSNGFFATLQCRNGPLGPFIVHLKWHICSVRMQQGELWSPRREAERFNIRTLFSYSFRMCWFN